MHHVAIRVPASTTNLGPGFDALGLALALYNRIRIAVRDAGRVVVRVQGEGAGMLETGEKNLVFRAASRVYQEVGAPVPPMEIELDNSIPVSRGLGSSSSAIVGGLVGANELLGQALDRERLLALAVEIEGHPDNVTPALLGGFQVVAQDGRRIHHLALRVPLGLHIVVCIPACAVSTAEARRVLPSSYTRADAVFNLGRTALLVAALAEGRWDVLRAAMEDRIHQPYRAPLVPGFQEALEAACAAGAAGACLSGSGSSLLALSPVNPEGVGEAMAAAVRRAGTDARWIQLAPDKAGATILEVA